jgi:RHS repeat-associated protein
MTASGSTCYYLSDALGSIRQVLDADQATQNSYDYEAFGSVYGSPTENLTQPFRFTGRDWDGEASLYYYRARMYDAGAGRFRIRDRVLSAGSPYVYVGGNPLGNLDPLGLDTYGAGFTLSAGAGLGAMVSPMIVTDMCNIAVVVTKGVGGEFPASIGASDTLQWTNANSIEELLGPGLQAGASGGPGATVGVDYVTTFTPGTNWEGFEFNLGMGTSWPVPAEAHFFLTDTRVICGPWNFCKWLCKNGRWYRVADEKLKKQLAVQAKRCLMTAINDATHSMFGYVYRRD